MTISETSISVASILVWFNSMNTRTSVNIARTLVKLNSINWDIGSRGVYLSIVERDDVAGGGDDVPVQSWEKQAAVEVVCRRVKSASENLIRPLPVQDHKDGGSGDMLSRTSVHADARMERLRRRRSSEKRKILIYYLWIFQTRTPNSSFLCVFFQENQYIYVGMRTPISTSSNIILINVVPLISTHELKH